MLPEWAQQPSDGAALLPHGLQSEDVDAALEALAQALAAAPAGGAQQPRLERLEIAAAAHFALPTGALVPAELLGEPEGQLLLRDRWPGAQLERRRRADGGDWLLLSFAPQR